MCIKEVTKYWIHEIASCLKMTFIQKKKQQIYCNDYYMKVYIIYIYICYALLMY